MAVVGAAAGCAAARVVAEVFVEARLLEVVVLTEEAVPLALLEVPGAEELAVLEEAAAVAAFSAAVLERLVVELLAVAVLLARPLPSTASLPLMGWLLDLRVEPTNLRKRWFMDDMESSSRVVAIGEGETDESGSRCERKKRRAQQRTSEIGRVHA